MLFGRRDKALLTLLGVLLIIHKSVHGFVRPARTQPSFSKSKIFRNHQDLRPSAFQPTGAGIVNNSQHMAAHFIPELVNAPSKGIIKLLCTFLAAAFLYFARRRSLLWPGARPDRSFSEPLPRGSLGCPFLGHNILAGNKKDGPEYFFRKASAKLGHPRLWKSYFMGAPLVCITGAPLVQDVLSKEFATVGSAAEISADEQEKRERKKKAKIFGSNNLMFEPNKAKHTFLRKLVGSGITPAALREALPTIQQIADETLDRALISEQSSNDKSTVKMEDVCVDYTLDVVRGQLLGLGDLEASERPVMREKLSVWLSAIYSLVEILPSFLIRRSAPYKARQYIEAKLQEKIDSLLENGPDTSTLSNMLFAKDVENNRQTLTREQVIENALVLVVAGSETASSTLTLAMLLLGLHPDSYQKVVQEQADLLERYNGQTSITPEQLEDKECPYLDAVVKEVLRLGAVSGTFARRVRETFVMDGQQIPKGWFVFPNIRLTHQMDPVTRLPDDSHMDIMRGFSPERWLSPETTPSDFVPFGAGPRYCLGSNLAMMEMKVFLAIFARRVNAFQIVGENAAGTISWNPQTMVPRPADGVPVRLGRTQNLAVKQS